MMPNMSSPDENCRTLRTEPSPPERLTRALAFGSIAALILLCVSWELWLAPTGRGSLAIKALPLLLPLAGLWRYRLYTYRAVSLLIWLYVFEGLLRASSDHGLSAGLALSEVLLSLLAFTACAWHIRLRLSAAKQA
jgi:uncharacterized membrane protein